MKRKLLLFTAFLALSMMVFGQATINCWPESDDYHTGTTDGVEFTETSLIDILSSGGPDGWARFDISEIPDGATVQSVELNMYITGDNNAWWQIMELSDDPLEGDAASVYADIADGDVYILYQQNFPEPGWFNGDLGEAAVEDVQYSMDNELGWFGVGVYEYEDYGSYYITVDGWAEDNPPFITVTYLVAGAPLPPFNPNPTHNAFSVGVDTDMTWDFGDETMTYDLYFGTEFPPTTLIVEDADAGETGLYNPDEDLEFTTTYHWQVIAKNDAELETPGPVWTFTTACDAWEVPFTEDFSSVSAPELPYCWSGLVNTSSVYYTFATITYNGIDGGNCLYMYNSDDLEPTMIFVTPELADGAAGMYANFWSWGYSSSIVVGTIADPNDEATFNPIDTVYNTGTYQDYIEHEVFLSNYTGTDTYIAFKGQFVNTYSSIYIDNILIGWAPTCPKPADLYSGSFTTTTADIGWQENGTATEWDLEYGEFGFEPTGEPTVTVFDNPTTLTDLASGTSYEFYVRAVCGEDDESFWVGPQQFQTACESTDVPWHEGFEDVTAPDLPPCIIVENTNDDALEWYVYYDTYDDGYAFDGDQSIRINYTYNNSMDDWFFSAPLNLVGGESYMVNFWYTCNSTYYVESMEVRWGTSAYSGDMGDDVIFVDESINYGLDNWQEASAFFTPEDDGTYYVGWHGYSIPGQYYLMVDYITIDVAPTCIKPTFVAVDSVDQDAAAISWVVNSEETSWNIEYGYAGFDPTGIGTEVVDSNPFTITDLESDTEYDVYVQADCGEGDLSWWSIKTSFRTLCDPVVVPTFEDFDGTTGNELPDCWRGLVETNGSGYVQINTWNGYSAPNALHLANTNDADAEIIAIAPPIMDIEEGVAGKWVRFYTWGYAPELAVGYMTNAADPSSFVAVTIIPLNNTYLGYEEHEAYFTNYEGDAELIAFKGVYSGTYQDIYIDDVTVDHPPTCPKPSDQFVSSPTTTSGVLNWTENGDATTWHLEYGYEGFLPSGTPLIITDENPYELMDLESGTAYDWYVQSFCEEGDSSEWRGPHTFQTVCEAYDVALFEAFDDGSAPELPICWTSLVDASNQYATVDLVTWQNYSAPASLHIYNSSDMDPVALMAISPPLTEDVSELWINFWAQGYAPWCIVGVITDPLDVTTFEAVDTVDLTNTWTEFEVFFDEYTGDGTFIAIRAGYDGTYQDIYIDDVVIDHPPTCPKPKDLFAFGSSATSATLGWEENGEATMWNIEYDYSGFTPTGIPNATADSNPFELTGLEDGSIYDYYVQANCSDEDQSYWVGPITFKTLCYAEVLAEGEYYEYFEDITPPIVPACIAIENVNEDFAEWGSSFDNANTGISHMQIDYNWNMPMDDWFFSAPLELLGGQTYNVQFYYANSYNFYTEALEVKFGSAPIADSMTSEAMFTDNLINFGPVYQDTIVQFIPAEDGVYFVGWHGMSSAGMDALYIDDIMIEWDNSLLVVATASPDTICEGATAVLNGEGIGGSGVYDYSWTSIPAGFTSDEASPEVSPTEPTDYILEIDDGFVSIFDTVHVHVKGLPAMPGTPSGITFFCASWGSATYSTTGGSGANWYDWSIDPVEAGELTGTGTSVSIAWAEGWLGQASLTVTGMNDDCAGEASTPLTINVYLPDVQLALDTACYDWEPYPLTGGTPAGGTYTGTGIDDDGNFDPELAGLGDHLITYTYSDAASCENYAEEWINVDVCSGLGDVAGNMEVVITPNPNSGIFTLKVKANSGERVNIKVLNNYGEEVYTEKNTELHNNYSTEIDLSTYAKGLYYLYIYNDDVNYVEKVIVK